MLIQNVLSYEDFSNYLDKYKYIIVNISASWCKPCMQIKPDMEKFISVIDESECVYLKLDNDIYDQEQEFNSFFNIKKIPYFGFIKDGVLIESIASGDFIAVSKKLHELLTTSKNKDNIEFSSNFKIEDEF
jgi:thiol-disulfide isomerase/thioredoxin